MATATPPSNIGYGTVVGQFILDIVDSGDVGQDPDFVPATGTITFVASVPKVLDANATPNPVTVVRWKITGVLDDAGYLCTPDPADPDVAGTRGLKLVATDDPDLNPVNWTWSVTYNLRGPDNSKLNAPRAHNMALPEGTTVDLTLVQPVEASTGNAIVVGPEGPQGPPGGVGPGNSDANVAGYVSGAGPTADAVAAKIVALGGGAVLWDGSAWPSRPDGAVSIRWVGGTTQPPEMTAADVWESIDTSPADYYKWHRDTRAVTSAVPQIATLAATPVDGSVLVTRNGLVLEPGSGYTIAGTEVTITPGTSGDRLGIRYMFTADQTEGDATWSEPGTYIADSFNRADSTTTLGNTDTGQTWIVPVNHAGTTPVWGISSNQAYVPTSRADDYAYVETGIADCVVQAKIAVMGTSTGLFLRATDASNALTMNGRALYVRTNGTNDTTAGHYIALTGYPTDIIVSGDTVRVVMNGTDIKVYRQAGSVGDFVLVGSGTITNYATNTKHGIRTGGANPTPARIDNFSVTSL